MESMITVYLYSIISFVIALAGTLICMRGFKVNRRMLFAYAAVFFANFAIYTAVFWILQFFSSPEDFRYIMISNYIAILFRYVSMGALVLMIWAFYQESRL